MNELTLVLSIVSILFTGITAFFSIMAYAKVVGMEKSTHQIQWVPVDEDGKTGKELDKDMYSAFGYQNEDQESIIP